MTALFVTLAVAAAAVTGCAIRKGDSGYRKGKNMSGQCGDNLTYEYKASSGKLTIKGTGAMTSCPWSGYGGVNVRTVEFEEGITSLCHGAFYAQSNLSGDLVLPSTLTYIDDFSFYGTSSLKSVKLAEGTTYLGDYAFRQSGITTIELPDSITYIGEECFDGCENLKGTLKLPSSLETIGRVAFGHCTGLTGDIIIPNSVTSIGNYAFNDCGFDGTLKLSENLTKIEDNCFCYTKGLKGDLIIPDSVTIIGRDAFNGCGFDGKLVLPAEMEEIGRAAFYSCSGLKGELVVPQGLTRINADTFENCSGFTSVSFPDSVRYICNSAFRGCKALSGELNLPNKLAGVGISAFADCSSLTGELKLPETVEYIENNAFSSCSGFTGTLELPDGLKNINAYAFGRCEGLSGDMVIPDSVSVIGPFAFYKCEGIDSVTIGQNMTSIGSGAFSECTGLKKAVFANEEVIADYYDTAVEDIAESFPEGCDVVTAPGAKPVADSWKQAQAEVKNKEKSSSGSAGDGAQAKEVPYYWTDSLRYSDFYGTGIHADGKLRFDETTMSVSINDREASTYEYTADGMSSDNSLQADKIWFKDGYLCNLAFYFAFGDSIVKGDMVHADGTTEEVYFVGDSSLGDRDSNVRITLEEDYLQSPQ